MSVSLPSIKIIQSTVELSSVPDFGTIITSYNDNPSTLTVKLSQNLADALKSCMTYGVSMDAKSCRAMSDFVRIFSTISLNNESIIPYVNQCIQYIYRILPDCVLLRPTEFTMDGTYTSIVPYTGSIETSGTHLFIPAYGIYKIVSMSRSPNGNSDVHISMYTSDSVQQEVYPDFVTGYTTSTGDLYTESKWVLDFTRKTVDKASICLNIYFTGTITSTSFSMSQL